MNEARRPTIAVGAVVLDARPEGPHVLLIKRARPPLEGQWSLPGGRVEWGERLHDALAREVREETGLEVRVGALLEVFEGVGDPAYHFVVLDYACEPLGGTLAAGDDVSDARWVAVFDLADYAVTADVRRVVSRAIADERE